MQTIYFISGLGSDEQVFSRLKIKGYKIVYITWPVPYKTETIQQYAKRMAEQIDSNDPIIVGLSFGGMMGIEIAKLLHPQKLILLSSIPSHRQLPAWMKLAGKYKLNKMLPMRSYKILQPVENWNMGVETEEDKKLVRHYRSSVNREYLDWAINEVLNWRNEWQPQSIFHIHGDKDRIFPVKKLSPTYTIHGGGHFMVFNKANEVSRLLQDILDN